MQNVVIAEASVAGLRCAQALRTRGFSEKIVLLGLSSTISGVAARSDVRERATLLEDAERMRGWQLMAATVQRPVHTGTTHGPH